MTKIHIPNENPMLLSEVNSTQTGSACIVDSSNTPNLTARIVATKYMTGEGTVRIYEHYKETTQSKPPKREGGILNQNGLTNKAKSKIKRACRCMQILVTNNKGYHGHCSFLTLTYGRDYPDDYTAKKHLDAFLKRLRRVFNNFHYVWVAEKQKRGAIHFHILTPNYIPKDLFNAMWNAIAKRWQKENGFEEQLLRPNIKAVENAAGYIAKYISKEGKSIGGNMYGMSGLTRELIKPVMEIHYEFSPDIIYDVIMDVFNATKDTTTSLMFDDFNNNPFIWSKDVDALVVRIKNIYDSV